MAEHYAGEGWSERNPIPTVQGYEEDLARRTGEAPHEPQYWNPADWVKFQSSGDETGAQGGAAGRGDPRAYAPQGGASGGASGARPPRVAELGYAASPAARQPSQHSNSTQSAHTASARSPGGAEPDDVDEEGDEVIKGAGGGEEEKEKIKKAATKNDKNANEFTPKGLRRVHDPTTDGRVLIEDQRKDMDLDAKMLDSRFGGGYSTRLPSKDAQEEQHHISPHPAEPTSLLLYPFPKAPDAEAMKAFDGVFLRLSIGLGVVLACTWLLSAFGRGWGAFFMRTVVLGGMGILGWSSIGLAQQRAVKHLDEARAHMHEARGKQYSPPMPESAEWLNAAIAVVWKQLDPAAFISVIDLVEDVMQASLPKFIQAVKISDFGLGMNPVRVIDMRGLADVMTDKEYPRKMWMERADQAASYEKPETGGEPTEESEERQKDPDQAGDFLNMEVSVCYSALPGQSSKTRATNVHLLVEFFLGAFDLLEITLPVWVQINNFVATVRVRAQIISSPPFLRNVTFTLMGVPSVRISAIPMARALPNVLDLPIISNFVQSSIAAAANMYVAPRSMTMNMRQMLAGDGVKKDTDAVGVLAVKIRYGQNLSSQDANGFSDPYCVLSFAKFGRPLYASRIIFVDLNPVWEEVAFLLMSKDDLRSDDSLSLQLWDSDKHTADDIVGRVNKPLRDLVRNPNKFTPHLSHLMGFEDADRMQGKLCWSVGFFEKAELNSKLTKKPDADASRAEKESERKPSPVDSEQEALSLNTPPDPQWPSGVLSVIVKHINGLEGREVEKGVDSDEREGPHGQDVQAGASALPCGYCEIILNDNLVYKTRVKQYSNMPFFNAGTEVFVRDWTQSDLNIVVRDARLREHDPIMGIVAMKLTDLFKDSSQVEQTFSLQDGVGYGKVALSIVFRSVQLQLPAEMRGFNTVSVDLLSNTEVTGNTQALTEKLNNVRVTIVAGTHAHKFGTMRKQPTGAENEPRLRIPVYDRYSTLLVWRFGRSLLPGVDAEFAIAVLPLWELADGQITDIDLPVIDGTRLSTLERNCINQQTMKTHQFEQIGTLSVRVRVNSGLDESFRGLVEGSRDRHEFEMYERLIGLPSRAEEASHANDDGVITRSERRHLNKVQTQELHMRHRGAMGYAPVRSAVWAKNGLKGHLRNFGNAVLGRETRDQNIDTEV
ncbi:hypothetical protein MSPP1_002687 [Malassezia sp. CBS 17886]|nr:hypothetical protein MSPP1_002687 [Malassezia sp. CBS 17886]